MTIKLFYVLVRHKVNKRAQIPSYYDGLSVFLEAEDAKRRSRTLEEAHQDVCYCGDDDDPDGGDEVEEEGGLAPVVALKRAVNE